MALSCASTAWAASTVLSVVVIILLLPFEGLDETALTFVVLVPVAAVVVAKFRSIVIGFATAFALGLGQSIFGNYGQLLPYQQVLPLGIIIVGLLINSRTPAFERV